MGKKEKRGPGFCFKNIITNAGEEKEKVVIAARGERGFKPKCRSVGGAGKIPGKKDIWTSR